MTKNSRGLAQLFVLILASATVIFTFFSLLQNTRITQSPINSKKEEMDTSGNFSSCELDSDCIFARNSNMDCPVGINKKYSKNYEFTCEDPHLRYCSQDILGKNCSWNYLACPGAPTVSCVENSCQVNSCGL